MLSDFEQTNLLKDFPNVELSYETIIHKTLHNPSTMLRMSTDYNQETSACKQANISLHNPPTDFVLAIPEGTKYFAWFTTYKAQNVCVLLEISENKKICNIQIASTCFHNQLSYGTIFYGTLFKHNNASFFCTEDIFYYKGKDISRNTFLSKLELFRHIFSTEIKQLSYTPNNIVFGLPLISSSYSELITAVDLLSYQIKYIQFKYAQRSCATITNMKYNCSSSIDHESKTPPPKTPSANSIATQGVQSLTYGSQHTYQNNRNNPSSYTTKQLYSSPKLDSKREIVFKVKPDIQNDIYNLHLFDNNVESFHEVAYITDYKTSVMMNKLFRNIKENQNLDALEESDDEEEFQNEEFDKFVHLDREFNMVCTYNFKYRKWMPIRVATKTEQVVTKNDLNQLLRSEKNKY